MKVKYTKSFTSAAKHLNGKELKSLQKAISGVKAANVIHEISDCRKLVGYDHVYRIRVGSRRAFFTFHVEVVGDTVFFRYLVPRGQAYDRHMQDLLRTADKE
ncbi:hypothetical protein [uncultured Muribaculum sp.]|uniref:type II toxin-antitoxin system RelE family toxin n=1 Tax=uncultured Muribaculum sp. TaxID=1918613 RepID=UPI0026175FEF|nr:hypothetical protein [uncultured Muribaculum sp.]